ncbi:uncharacterized protein LOC142344064 [Convolutriloba macropyga]|uniref:uncharacterized protein LOC142344064 n=1 Tax=Convolutriloba macropyga TaxID=536237 RepID=UPI003F52777D
MSDNPPQYESGKYAEATQQPPPQTQYGVAQTPYPPSSAPYPPANAGPPPVNYGATGGNIGAPPSYQYPPYPQGGQAMPPPMPQPATAPPPQPQVVTQVITTTPLVNNRKMGRVSVVVNCPNCHATVSTRVELNPGALAWIFCLGLLLFGCWLGCCLIPFCVDSCQDARHICPNCGATVGSHSDL